MWFVNDRINLLSNVNLELVAAALRFPNIAFGLHRWFYRASGPDPIAVATSEQWEAELARGRPGDNLMLLSLEAVRLSAMVHVGDVPSTDPLRMSPQQQQQVREFLADDRHEIAVVHRSSPDGREVSCSYEVLWNPGSEEWDDPLRKWSQSMGELFLFNNDILWQDVRPARSRTERPPEEWTPQHGMFLADGYIPDEDGRVVCRGAY
jgi:hypothetical protein